jgi:hypothetical protein
MEASRRLTMNKHTSTYHATPWKIASDVKTENYVIKNRSGLSVAVCGYKEHAEHIVLAVNAHQDLVEALKMLAQVWRPDVNEYCFCTKERRTIMSSHDAVCWTAQRAIAKSGEGNSNG